MALARVMGITMAMGVGVVGGGVGSGVLGGAVIVVVRKVVRAVSLAMADSGAMGSGSSGHTGLVLSGIRAGGAVSIGVTVGKPVRVVELRPALDSVEDPAMLFPSAGAVVAKPIS